MGAVVGGAVHLAARLCLWPDEVAQRARGYEILKRSTAKLAKAGAPIVLGSDTGLEDHFFGYAEQKELGLMVEAGLTPMQAIVAATSRAAEFVKLSDRGTLAAGKRAEAQEHVWNWVFPF